MSNGTFIGLMSGTSLDGVDAALVDMRDAPKLLATCYLPFSADLRAQLLSLQTSGDSELERAAGVANQLAHLYAEAVEKLLDVAGRMPGSIEAIGCHGQTVRHRPDQGYTLQLNNPALLAERTGISVVADFRSRDIAAGGQGAPLVPAFHAACFTHASINRIILNIGGIANITYLPAASNSHDQILGFDTGPGNLLLDHWAEKHTGASFDAGGEFSASGECNAQLLRSFMSDPYFELPPPKSTGRDLFNATWLDKHTSQGSSPADVQASLAELTARSIKEAAQRWCPAATELHVCGGGAHNADLMNRLGLALSNVRIGSTEALGVHPDWVEAMAFAWLAHRTLTATPGNLPAVTGAAGPRVLGAIYPA
jgi:anhydro-N-acetylmuramic acid kinase